MDYSDLVIEHFERPRNVAGPETESSHRGRAGTRAAGAIIEFYLDLAGDTVRTAFFRAWGCPHTIAVASWLTEQLPQRRLSSLLPLDLAVVAEALGMPAVKWHCVLTAEDALRAALEGKTS